VRDDFLRERGRVRAHEVVYNGVDARALQADAAEGVAFRSQIGIPPDARVATMLGRIIGWKGQHVFVAAMRALASEDPNVYGLIVGGAEFFSEEYARQVDAQVRDSGFDNRIRLCGYRDDIAAVLAASDVVVHASLEPEAFGRVIIEAMAAGRPVVGSMVGGVPELIEDGVSGLLVPPNDAARLARAVRRILDDRDLARRLAEGGLKRVREDFDIRLHLERVSKIYEAMVC
jgi:glycosyltransferase involved in cell wall biosynthesis